MEFKNLVVPKGPKSGDAVFGINIAPIDRLKTFSDTQFEEIVNEWAFSYLQDKYDSVYRNGGSGDKGIDIIAYYDLTKKEFDIYQCKHYGSPLSPSDYWLEFGKLCYYTYSHEYDVPINYYIVASQGVGGSLRKLIINPQNINNELINKWNNYCKDRITKEKTIELVPSLESYIKSFDFSIVKEVEPLKLLEQYSQTKWFKYRFGGGIPKRPKPEKPSIIIKDEEKRLQYIKELIDVYNEYSDGKLKDLDDLKKDYMLFDHFTRQREDYHCAQSLKRFSRDEFIDNPYEEAKEEIYRSVIDICNKKYLKSLERVNQTTSEARKISLDGNELGKVNPSDKSGMCHELVNDKKLKWVNNNGEIKNI